MINFTYLGDFTGDRCADGQSINISYLTKVRVLRQAGQSSTFKLIFTMI